MEHQHPAEAQVAVSAEPASPSLRWLGPEPAVVPGFELSVPDSDFPSLSPVKEGQTEGTDDHTV
jgi:hypothetical protein